MVYSDVYLAIAYFANVVTRVQSVKFPKETKIHPTYKWKAAFQWTTCGHSNFSEQASLVKTWDFVVVKNQKHAIRVNNRIDDICDTCSNVVAEDAEGRRQMATECSLSWCKRWDTQWRVEDKVK